MILNISHIKTEALLLICRDIILSYKDKDDIGFILDETAKEYIKATTNEILKQLQIVTYPNEYYVKKINSSKIKSIMKSYTYINESLSKELKTQTIFNPFMLCFALLSTWFAELSYESKSKRFIYFSLYPYAEVYDKLLLNIKDNEFKLMNISMIELAERIIMKLDKISLK